MIGNSGRIRVPTASALAITGVNVVPMDADAVIADHTVLINDGIITDVAPSSAMGPVAPETQAIDGSGHYLLPGLADMHVHLLDFATAPLYLAFGVTTVRNMWGYPAHLEYQRRYESAPGFGPRVITTSPVLDGLLPDGSTFWPNSQWIEDPMAAQSVVDGFAAMGYQQIKALSNIRPEVLKALGSASATAGLRLVGHCPSAMSFEDAIAAGMSCFEHLYNLGSGRSRKWWSAGSAGHDSLRRLADQMAEQQVWNCPTQVVFDHGPAVGGYRRPPRGAVAGVVNLLHTSGAPLLAGTDTPAGGLVPGAALHEELGFLENAGLSPYEALRCATTEAARFVGDGSGTVAPGQRADLVLTRTNPLSGTRALRDIEAVVSNGRLVDRSKLEALKADLLPSSEVMAGVGVKSVVKSHAAGKSRIS